MKTVLSLIALFVVSGWCMAQQAPTGELRLTVAPPAYVSVDYQAPELGDTFTKQLPASKQVLLKVSKPGYETLYRTVSVAGNAICEETITLKRQEIPVLFRANVPATILLDGAVLGETPYHHFFKAPRIYQVEVEAEGYQSQKFHLNLTNGKPQVKTFELKSNSGTLQLTSYPSGAQVFLDGIERGTTPCTLTKLREATYTLSLKKAGYNDHTVPFKMAAGETLTQQVTLVQLPAALKVTSSPTDAQVYLDGIYRGKTPLELKGVAAGTHLLRVKKDGHGESNRTIRLSAGKTSEETFTLNVILGSLTVQTEPATVAVYNGHEQLFMTSPKAPSDYRSARLTHALAPGKYTLTFKANGYATTTRDVIIEANKTTTLAVKLDFKPNFKVRTTSGTIVGVWISNEANGDLRIEVQPGMIKRIPAADILGKSAIVE